LVALTIEPTLWTLLHDQGGEALLFRRDDFTDYLNSRPFLALSQSPEPELKALAAAMSGLWTSDVRAIPSLNPANLPPPNKQSTLTAATATSANAAIGPIPDWVTQALLGPQPTATGIQSNPSWITGHLPALSPVVFNPTRLTLRLLSGFVLATVIAVGLSAKTGVLSEVMAAVGACLAILVYVITSIALFRRTPERRAKRQKAVIYKERRAESAAAAREVSKFEHARRDVDNRQKKAVDIITKKADKAKASEQKELAEVNSTLAAQVQKLGKQKQKLQSSELNETGHALRALQHQHVATYLSRALISSAKIPGIGPGVVRSLAACGIMSAADFAGVQYQTGPRGGQQIYIRRRSGSPVHPSGVGEKKALDLENWRRMLEGRAIASQPSSLLAAQAQAIRARYTQQRQAIADQEKAAQAQAINDLRQVGQKWAPIHLAISGELVVTRQAFAQERAQTDLHVTTAQKQASTTVWHRELAEREIAAYRNVSYRRYLAGVIRA
jgi:hypothetical protein